MKHKIRLNQKLTIRKNGTTRIQSINDEPSMTKQEFKDDCDPTQILKRFAITGNLDHAKQYDEVYGQTSALSYHEASELTAKAETMFQDLPSKTRKQFNHSVEEFLDWVGDPKNAEQLQDKGDLDLLINQDELIDTDEVKPPEGVKTKEKATE